MAKVYVPQACAKEGIDFLLQQGYEVTVGNDPGPDEFQEVIADYDAVLLRTTRCPESVLSAGKRLKIVARHGVGYDNVDIGVAERLGIWVTNTPQSLSDSVAEYTLTVMLMAAKNIVECSTQMYRGNFNYKKTHKGVDLFGKTLGIVGFGRIGRTVAKKAHFGLDMKILTYGPTIDEATLPDYVEACSKEELFARSDFVTLHMPGGEKNRGDIGQREFSVMKPTAILINAARGEVLDEAALDQALKDGKLARAVLDVQSSEPPEADYPLYQNDKVLLTPHMASNTEECMARMALHAAWQIHKVLSGDMPDWPVNCPKGLGKNQTAWQRKC